MVENLGAKSRVNAFVSKLRLLNYSVNQVSVKPQIYAINNKLINIRATANIRENTSGVVTLWYDVSENILEQVDYIAYLTTTPDYFVLIPSEFLANLYQDMYVASDKEYARSFMVDWDACFLLLKQRCVDVMNFYQNLIEVEDYPNL